MPDGVGRGLGRRKEDYILKASYINMNIIHIILYAYTSNLLNKNCNLDFLNRICLDFKVPTKVPFARNPNLLQKEIRGGGGLGKIGCRLGRISGG